MTEEQKLRCNELKERYKKLLKEKSLQRLDNKFKEFIKLLGEDIYIFYMSDEMRLNIYEECYTNFSFKANASKIDESKLKYFNEYYINHIGDLFNNKKIFKECNYVYYYIICGENYPIIKCKINKFFENKDFIYELNYLNSEVLILLSENFKQIIYIYHGINVMIGEI